MSSDGDGRSPLYRKVQRDLRATLLQGDYEPGAFFTTERDVCERFGVSTTTAVRALNELVAEGLVVRQPGRGTFVADRAAPRTAETPAAPTPGPGTVFCVLHGLPGPHVADVLAGIQTACGEIGYRLVLADSGGTPAGEAEALRQAVAAGADGVVLYPCDGRSDPTALDEVHRRGVPIVMVDRYSDELPTDAVFADNFLAGHALTTELIARGHARIGTLWSETETTSVRDRLSGHKHALREHGLPVLPALTTLRSYLYLPETRRRAVLTSMLDGPDRPTVLLCANGFALATAVTDLLALGVGVPDEVDLAGMDTAGPFDLLPLTAVAAVLPSREMGRQAVGLLHSRLTGTAEPAPRHVTLPVGIRVRESSTAHLRAVTTGPVPA
ncbi:LacI family DNA-binding transcriptional regulator [Polymorphospora rubra]|uniref:LacI family transcriptional regulator n=1 Tax=Polymorphospora rubra TaxID=338584 RepID=A0A810NG48_9ACTN|nr:LacI family DNA-binding transcriptional regulator [Polymorphospora rubra]BCJ70205.1 LacI family transcriptional regulator [Polymorphospora rubra]